MEHELKTWPDEYQAVVRGDKRFELRVNDRGFKVGDVLVLREFGPYSERYTGSLIRCKVTYILTRGFGLPDGLCIMSIELQR